MLWNRFRPDSTSVPAARSRVAPGRGPDHRQDTASHRRGWVAGPLAATLAAALWLGGSATPAALGQQVTDTPTASPTPPAGATATPTPTTTGTPGAAATDTPGAATATSSPTASATAGATGTATATAVAASATPTAAAPTATVVVAPAPTAVHDARYFFETQFRVDHDPFWDYFNARGGVTTFGFPVSRTFTFLGCTTQFFQRQLMQQCGTAAPVQTMNLLDPDLMPYNQINFSSFPAHDPAVASAAPAPGTPNYAQAVLTHIQMVAPDTLGGLPVRFFSTFVTTVPGVDPARDPNTAALVNLEIWGFPTSNPQPDPNNRNFVYQRFQRGIMHFDASAGVTRGILLSDYFKSVITGRNLPPDLAAQAANSRFLQQYCPGAAQWICRPAALEGTDLTFAFEQQ